MLFVRLPFFRLFTPLNNQGDFSLIEEFGGRSSLEKVQMVQSCLFGVEFVEGFLYG